jgi:hypothetical protein
MSAFVPDPNSRPSKVADYVQNVLNDAGDAVSYAELADLIGVPWDHTITADNTKSLTIISQTITETNDRLYKRGDWKRLQSVPNLGYKVATVADLYDEAVNREQRAIRQLSRGLAATSQIVHHPDASPADRAKAVNAAAQRGEVLAVVRAKARSTRGQFRRPETSPVPPNGDDDD